MEQPEMSIDDKSATVLSRRHIQKKIVTPGIVGNKPAENSVCTILITLLTTTDQQNLNSELLNSHKLGVNQQITIGQLDTDTDRQLEDVIKTMFEQEECDVTCNSVSFRIKLVRLTFDGYVFEWSTAKKHQAALAHKDIGIKLFGEQRYVDAFYRFSKAIKLLLTCVQEVGNESKSIDGIEVIDIEHVTQLLYGNLASCHYKCGNYEDVIVLCNRVLAKNPDDMKALYKRGMAFVASREWDKAHVDLAKFLVSEPDNSVVQHKLAYVRQERVKSRENYANICKNMFK